MKITRNIVVGASDAVTAYICSRLGADYVWASSLVMTAMLGKRDGGICDIREYLPLLRGIITGARCPVMLDFDIGGKNIGEYRSNIRQLRHERLGSVCIEDEGYPKVNAMVASSRRTLITPSEMVQKVRIAKQELGRKVKVVARVHSLIIGESVPRLQERVIAYADAGADILCVHYTGDKWQWYDNLIKTLHVKKPLLVILARAYSIPHILTQNRAYKFFLFPNQIYRTMLRPLMAGGVHAPRGMSLTKYYPARTIDIESLLSLINQTYE